MTQRDNGTNKKAALHRPVLYAPVATPPAL